MSRLALGATLTVAALAGTAREAHAGDLQVTPPRSLGMGGALRGSAAGGGAMMLNPSGMSLVRTYVVEGSYQFLDREHGHIGHVSVVDSTSGFNLAGGLYYTYATGSPGGDPDRRRHEGGLALSFPFGDRMTVGGTLRYVRAHRDAGAGPVQQPATQTNGLTFDAGVTIRPVRPVTLGVVGYGLRDLHDPQAPRALGGGVAVTPVEELIIALDGLIDFRTAALEDRKTLSVFGGGEYTFGSRFAVRAGAGRSGTRERSFATAGISLLSEVGALDVGGRADLQGSDRDVFFGIAGRLFVPTP